MDWSKFELEIISHAYEHGITEKEIRKVVYGYNIHEIVYAKGEKKDKKIGGLEKRYHIIGEAHGKVISVIGIPIGKILKIISAYPSSTKYNNIYQERKRKDGIR